MKKITGVEAIDQWAKEECERYGGLPTPEEVLAYHDGTLTEQQKDAIQHRPVICGGDLSLLDNSLRFPAEGAEPGDPDYLPDEEFAKHWKQLQKRMAQRKGPRFWRVAAIAGVAAVLILGVLLWRVRVRGNEPRVVYGAQVLFPDGRVRPGGEPAALTAHGEDVLLVPALLDRLSVPARITILDLASKRELWRSSVLQVREDDALALVVPRRFLEPGDYRIVVSGSGGEPIATYSLRVPR